MNKMLKGILTLKKIRSQYNKLSLELADDKWLSNFADDIAYTLTIVINDSTRLLNELNKRQITKELGFNPRERKHNEDKQQN